RLRERAGVLVDVAVDLDVDCAAPPPDLDRLVDELDGRSDRDVGVEPLDVLGIEADAAVRHLHPDAPRDVGAVDTVEAPRQLEAVLPERVLRIAARDEGPIVTALADVLAPDRLGDVPPRVHGLRADPEFPARRAPVVATEADRVRRHANRAG